MTKPGWPTDYSTDISKDELIAIRDALMQVPDKACEGFHRGWFVRYLGKLYA